MTVPAEDRISLDDVYERIRQAIITGQLAPDARMSQVQLAQQLGISRTPVREALRMIQREGLVEAVPGRQVRIAPTSVQDLDQLYALRINMETFAVRNTVGRLTDEDIAEMKQSLHEMAEHASADDFATWDRAHRRLHEVLVRPAGSRFFALSAQLGAHAERYRRKYLSQPQSWQPAHADHTELVTAAHARDSVRAARVLAEHYARVALSTASMVDPTFEPVMIRAAIREALHGPNEIGSGRPGVSGRNGEVR